MSDYISREAVLETICHDCSIYNTCNGKCADTRAIRAIPAADVRPVVRGRWANYGDEYRPDIKCCVCGQKKPILLGNFGFNFCPNCGADMREES